MIERSQKRDFVGDITFGVHDCTVILGVKPEAVGQIISSFVTTVNIRIRSIRLSILLQRSISMNPTEVILR